MKINRITPEGLPEREVLRLEYLYHTEPGDFAVIADSKGEILYINRTVSQRDAEGFLEVAEFPKSWVADEEKGKGKFLAHVFSQYGSGAYLALMDVHRFQMQKEKQHAAEETAKEYLPLVENAISGNLPIGYNEWLLYEIQRAGCRSGRKTSENMISYGSLYLFYLGYLMGTGMLEGIS